MSKKVTFTVTKDPYVATEDDASKPATQVIFGNYVTAGTILSSDIGSTSDANVTNDEIVFKDSASYTSYIAEIGSDPLNDGYTISNYVVS